MRLATLGLAILCMVAPLRAESRVAVNSTVFIERGTASGLSVEPAARFASGDRVITVMTWQAGNAAAARIVSAVPAGLELQSVSRDGLEYSTDGGRAWGTVADGRELPRGVTHLRWRTAGSGTLSYRAIVR